MEKVKLNKMLDEMNFNESYLLFIQQYVYGVPLYKIKQNLNVKTEEELASIKEDIKNRFAVTNDLDIIKKAYDLNIIAINDDLKKNWRDFAFRIAYNIYLCSHYSHIEEINLKLVYIKILRMYVTILKKNVSEN